MILRGQEGSIQLPLDRRAPILTDFNKTPSEEDSFVRPEHYGLPTIEMPQSTEEIRHLIQNSVKIGTDILNDSHSGPEKNLLIYLVSTIVDHFHLIPKEAIHSEIQQALKSKKALHHWQKA